MQSNVSFFFSFFQKNKRKKLICIVANIKIASKNGKVNYNLEGVPQGTFLSLKGLSKKIYFLIRSKPVLNLRCTLACEYIMQSIAFLDNAVLKQAKIPKINKVIVDNKSLIGLFNT